MILKLPQFHFRIPKTLKGVGIAAVFENGFINSVSAKLVAKIMTKQQTIDRITAYLPHIKEDVLASMLNLLENIEFEDDDWDLQMQADGQAGLLDDLVDQALDEYEKGEAGDLFEGFEEHAKKVSS